MYSLRYALYVCLIDMCQVWFLALHYIYALYVCLICMPYMYALCVCLICDARVPCVYALCVCLICVRHMWQVWYFGLAFATRLRLNALQGKSFCFQISIPKFNSNFNCIFSCFFLLCCASSPYKANFFVSSKNNHFFSAPLRRAGGRRHTHRDRQTYTHTHPPTRPPTHTHTHTHTHRRLTIAMGHRCRRSRPLF